VGQGRAYIPVEASWTSSAVASPHSLMDIESNWLWSGVEQVRARCSPSLNWIFFLKIVSIKILFEICGKSSWLMVGQDDLMAFGRVSLLPVWKIVAQAYSMQVRMRVNTKSLHLVFFLSAPLTRNLWGKSYPTIYWVWLWEDC